MAQAKTEPHQLRSVPTLATPAMPVSAWPCSVPSITFATVEPSPFACVSARSTSSKSGARYTRCVAKPRYSWVTWNSIISGVFGIAPKSGWKGSRGWKSIGPFLTCTSTFGRNFPSRGLNSL